ncbi:2,6-dihydropseudooxynicotine hydrolase [Talaromyces proteolyticus]|uniref:2,6-dihydropseudooxynicotine hydrolase n=1 Tax=Talaromyces proteolyticus TaxID=1131652 RepID=A0AAD4KWJ1_9EURO|nr:2,6-dihydropseudooxynicotine hydrolase [Talaromyces proteolyticus]KAH8698478.1 2,6-dihydropseudooxynicotine hydrolase [Talaromyces proteolyticus]
MSLIFPDGTFDFEFNRILAHARYRGSDFREVLSLVPKIKPGDFDSWHTAFVELAQRAEASAGAEPQGSHEYSRRVSYADRLFAASTYYRAADFFLHGNPDDPRINTLWDKQAACFDTALKHFGNGTRHLLKADSFSVPIIYFKAPVGVGPTGPKKTILIGNGFDGAMEEMLHVNGIAGLERGYNVILFEGPGQCTVRREQKKGFIHDWERVVTPVVDFALTLEEVDKEKIVLFGYSMSGQLAVRAAAYEHRLAATVAIDGVFDVGSAFKAPEELLKLYSSGEEEKFIQEFGTWMFDPSTPTPSRWIYQHGLWAFNVATPVELFDKLKAFTLEDSIDNVRCPVYVGDAQEDIFFQGQPEIMAERLGDKANLRLFTTVEGAGMHCQVGAASLLNADVFDWLERTFQG